MILLIFHLVLSSFTFDGVDMTMASKILRWNVERYPNGPLALLYPTIPPSLPQIGVFFLFGEGRLLLKQGRPAAAIDCYKRALNAQTQYTNLHHISHWEMAVAHLALWAPAASLESWRVLERDATWSKATYAYGVAACLLEIGGKQEEEEARKLMGRVPELRQRIAGKSIPLEKFVARKAAAFVARGSRLPLPALELAYHFHALEHSPRTILVGKVVPLVGRAKERLEEEGERKKEGWWDEMCLVRFLEGVVERFVAYPVRNGNGLAMFKHGHS